MPDQLPDFEGGAGRRVESLPVINPRSDSPGRWLAIAPSGNALPADLMAVWVNQACTITMTGDDNASEVFTVAGAGPLPLKPTKITAISTGTVIGLYPRAS